MKKWVVSAALAISALLVLALPVSAGWLWCAKDPIVSLNGTAVQIWVAVPAEYQAAVNGPVEVVVKTPTGVSQEVVFIDEGFNGHGEIVEFGTIRNATVASDGTFDTLITASVPVDVAALAKLGVINGTIPFQVTVVTNGELDANESGQPTVVNGETLVAEGLSTGVKISVSVKGTR